MLKKFSKLFKRPMKLFQIPTIVLGMTNTSNKFYPEKTNQIKKSFNKPVSVTLRSKSFLSRLPLKASRTMPTDFTPCTETYSKRSRCKKRRQLLKAIKITKKCLVLASKIQTLTKSMTFTLNGEFLRVTSTLNGLTSNFFRQIH